MPKQNYILLQEGAENKHVHHINFEKNQLVLENAFDRETLNYLDISINFCSSYDVIIPTSPREEFKR